MKIRYEFERERGGKYESLEGGKDNEIWYSYNFKNKRKKKMKAVKDCS